MPFLSKLRKQYNRGPTTSRYREIIHDSVKEHEEIMSSYVHKSDNSRYKIGIIGGGLAGIHSAWILSKLGFKVKVFEATERLGGRVHTLYDDKAGRIVEAGAEFIGLNHAIWLGLAKHFNLGMKSTDDESQNKALKLNTSIVIEGNKLSQQEVDELETKLDNLLMKISNEAKIITYPNQPWLETDDIKKLDNISVLDMLNEWNIEPDVIKMFSMFFENENTAELDKHSWLGLLCAVKGSCLNGNTEEYWDIMEEFTCAKGNQELINKMKKEIRGKIYVNSPVVKITKMSKSGKIHLTIKNKCNKKRKKFSTYCFDYVISSISPEVWNKIIYKPFIQLNKYKPSSGPAIKYVGTVKDRFWIDNSVCPTTLNDIAGEGWEQTINQTNLKNQYISLASYSGGSYARNIINNENPVELVRNNLNINYEDELHENIIRDTIFSHPDMEYIKTGFSYPGLGKIMTVGKRLNEPVKEFDNKLFWAGEHVSMSFFGFMEGALRSSIIAVELLLNEIIQ